MVHERKKGDELNSLVKAVIGELRGVKGKICPIGMSLVVVFTTGVDNAVDCIRNLTCTVNGVN